MKQLVLLYWGCVFLLYLSQIYCPVDIQISERRIGKHHFILHHMDIFMVFSTIWMTCFSFLRTSYNDTKNYIDLFNNAVSVNQFLAEGQLLDLTGNPLSYFYESIMRSLTQNYHIYFFFPAFLSSFAVISLFKRYSVNPAISLLVFFSIGTYVIYIAALKQCFAIFFLLIGLPYAEEKKYWKFYLFVLVAILFHTHAFIFLIIPILFDKPWGKITWIFLAASLFGMVTYRKTFGAFMNYAQSIGALVAEEELFDGHQINFMRVLVYWVPPLIALVFRKRLFNYSTRAENLFVQMSCISAFILMIGLIEGANLYARMAAYFEIATPIAFSWMIDRIFTKRSSKIIFNLSGIFYFVYFFYEFSVSKSFSSDFSKISIFEFIEELFLTL